MRRTALLALPLMAMGFAEPVVADTDLAIGFDRKTSRPNVFIAWRNTQRILEVHGERQARGELRLQILDYEGNVLDYSPRGTQPPIHVVLPPAEFGGREGKIVQMHGSKELNLLIDRLDRANERYLLKAEVVSDVADSDLLNNVAVKSFNVQSLARADSQHFYDYYIVNRTGMPVDALWVVEHSPLPAGWRLDSSITDGSHRHLAPGETVQGVLTLTTPAEVSDGQHVDVRVAAINSANDDVIGITEWYAVRDTVNPEISAPGFEVDELTGIVSVQVTATDDDSMIKEASGARVEYSTDGGATYSSRVMAYLDGNFVGPTRFLADLGPFAKGTEIIMSLIVEDIAGNKAKHSFEPLVVGSRQAAAPAPVRL